MQAEYKKHPHLANPELADFVSKVRPQVHEHYEPTLAWMPVTKEQQEKIDEISERITQKPLSQQPKDYYLHEAKSAQLTERAEAKIIAYRLATGQDKVENVIKKICPNLKSQLEQAVRGQDPSRTSRFYFKDSEFDQVLKKLFEQNGVKKATEVIKVCRERRLGSSMLGVEKLDIDELLNSVKKVKKDVDSFLKPKERESEEHHRRLK